MQRLFYMQTGTKGCLQKTTCTYSRTSKECMQNKTNNKPIFIWLTGCHWYRAQLEHLIGECPYALEPVTITVQEQTWVQVMWPIIRIRKFMMACNIPSRLIRKVAPRTQCSPPTPMKNFPTAPGMALCLFCHECADFRLPCAICRARTWAVLKWSATGNMGGYI